MATLVLSTVGSALGGPVGGAIGALIGQSLDQQFLGPAKRGPRLGDLSVQTSSYGTEIPRIYGSMRVAGTVIWATDLVEGEQASGVKGQPDLTYSYSVSLSVALSSRPVASIGRIWADGNLLRGADGDFKVSTTFRFHDGSENQEIDALIGSTEGIANTPAYRGLAYAVFENLELAAFGNRIPFLTFEVFADSDAPQLSSVLADSSGDAIETDSAQPIAGYAAYGASISAALQPLVDCFDLQLFDDGTRLRSPADAAPVTIAADELGSSGDRQKAPKLLREQLSAGTLPTTLRLTYYDTARDYQSGEARAAAGPIGGKEQQVELPAVLSATDAKTLAQQMLARQWCGRDKLTLSLPPARLTLEPGSIVQPEFDPNPWVVDKCTIDGFATIVELTPSWRPSATVAADPGRIVPGVDVIEFPATIALFDVLDPLGAEASRPAVLIAASSASTGWTARPLTVTAAGQSLACQTAVRKSVLGSAVTALGNADPYLLDQINSVDVQLIDEQQWLTSCDDDALADGTNLAVIGSEVVQFGEVVPLGEGRFRLSRLLRGRGGTESAGSDHAAGESFCLLDRSSLASVAIPIWARGSTLTAADQKGSSATLTFEARSVRPLSPVNLATSFDSSGNLELAWTRRSRAGFAWIDEVDVPIGEAREQYAVSLAGSDSSLDLTCDTSNLTLSAADVRMLGSGQVTIQVRQVGDLAASLPAQISFQAA
jgi:hypothetical protein